MLTRKQREWLAGVIDGDGNFDIRKINNKKVLKTIRIVQSVRDINILNQVKNLLKGGKIRKHTKTTFVYCISNKELMEFCVNMINGNIRIKIDNFIFVCEYLNIKFIEPNYIIQKNSSYFAGLIDTDGSIVFNYEGNRIDLFLEFKRTKYTLKLDFSNVISNIDCKVYKFIKRNQNREKIFYSIRFAFANKKNMLLIHDYFRYHRLYSEFKFFRVMKIKEFLEIRHFKNYLENSLEYKIYHKFLYKFFIYRNESEKLPSFIKIKFFS